MALVGVKFTNSPTEMLASLTRIIGDLLCRPFAMEVHAFRLVAQLRRRNRSSPEDVPCMTYLTEVGQTRTVLLRSVMEPP